MTSENNSQSQVFDIDKLQELLRPVREVAAIWDIPLLGYLDSYLDDLRNIDLSQDFDPSKLNFSQAGLFLQGSTNVYAKKVKFLYDLVTNSTASIIEQTSDDTESKKRKKKSIDFVIDDQLADIDLADFEISKSKRKENDESESSSKLGVTTMPKIPLCLLGAIDSLQSTGDSYRISETPSDDFCVIMLDRSTKFTEETDSSEFPTFPVLNELDEPKNELDEPKNEVVEATSAPQSPFRQYFSQEIEENNIPDLPENDDDVVEGFPVPPSFEEEEDIVPKLQENCKMLDPDSTELQFTMKPFRKMKKIKIPVTYHDDKLKKNKTSKKPFHFDLFDEIFEQAKKFRKKRYQEEDREALEVLIPQEGGLDHVLNDIDAFAEPLTVTADMLPNLQNISFDKNSQDSESLLPLNSEILIDDDFEREKPFQYSQTDTEDEYRLRCKELIKYYSELGKKRVHLSRTAEVLEQWEKRVSPKLNKQLNRKSFVVPDVQEWIIDMLKMHNGTLHFKELTAEVEQYEVSRIFLSLLILANYGKVDLSPNDNVDVHNDFLIRLLNV